MLLMRQFDIETDAVATRFKTALIGRFHHPRATTRNDAEARLSEQFTDLNGFVIVQRVFCCACTAENTHGLIDMQ